LSIERLLSDNIQQESTSIYDSFRPFLRKSRAPLDLASVTVQRQVVLSLASFLRMHSIRYHSIAQRLQNLDENVTLVQKALLLAEFRDLIEDGRNYVQKLADDSRPFILYSIAFQKDPTLFPYFLFFNEWVPQYPLVMTFETPHPVNERRIVFHFCRDAGLTYKVEVTAPDGRFEPGVELRMIHPNDHRLDCTLTSPVEFLIHRPTSVYCEFVVSDEVTDLSSVWGVKITFTMLLDSNDGKPCCSGDSYREFIGEMRTMLAHWKPDHDACLVPHVKELDVFEFLPPQSLVKLNQFSKPLIQMRFSFLRKFNELLPSDFNRLPVRELDLPLVAVIMGASHGMSPAIKLCRLEKLVCKHYNEKKLFRFNRSRALIARADSNATAGRSLFDQVIDQIPISLLPALKCNDAPWRVSLEGEGATDVGGPGRDLFSDVSSELCLPHNHLFVATSTGEFVPDVRCKEVNRFVYAGAFVALAFITRLQQPYKFATLVWAFLAGQKVTIEHVYEIDPDFRTWVANAEKEVAMGSAHYVVPSFLGEQAELFVAGATVGVMTTDYERYRNLAVEFRVNEFNPCLKKMREGFSIFLGEIGSLRVTADELRSFICGSVDIPMTELEQLIQVVEGTPEEEAMLYEVLDSFSVEERMLFIKFATGKMSVPAAGAGWNGCLNVEFIPLSAPPYMLPLAATCSSTVSIPRYPTKEILAEKLRAAITYGGEFVLDHEFDAGGIIA
jgi:hypothetical protein